MPIFPFSNPFSEQSKKRELSQIKKERRATKDKAVRSGHRKRKKTVQQEIFELERELRAAKERRSGEPQVGALPDFIVIGEKCGATFLYHLLSQRPLAEPAAAKEVHFFNRFFDEGIEWYRRCFPQPTLKDGRKTITGEATPGYLRSRLAPERMAGVVPRARLIVLLRNPVDRTYSDYQQGVRKGRETRTFEEAIGLEEADIEAKRARQRGGEGETSEQEEDGVGLDDPLRGYLIKSVYADQLVRWSEYFDKEEEYFEPHNRRLYDFLGVDFGR